MPPSTPIVNREAAPGRHAVDFEGFLLLTREDVEREARRMLRKSPLGRTWFGLFSLMERQSYTHVHHLGAAAARIWATHLGVLPAPAKASADSHEPAAGPSGPS